MPPRPDRDLVCEHRPTGAVYAVTLVYCQVHHATGPLPPASPPDGRLARLRTLLARRRLGRDATAFVRTHWADCCEVTFDEQAQEFYEECGRDDVGLEVISDTRPPTRRGAPPAGLYRVEEVGPYDLLAEPARRRWYVYHREYHALAASGWNLCQLGITDVWQYDRVWAWRSLAGARRHAEHRLQDAIDASIPGTEGLVRRPGPGPYWWWLRSYDSNSPSGPWASAAALRAYHYRSGHAPLVLDPQVLDAPSYRLRRQPDVEARRDLVVEAATAAEARALAERWASPVWWCVRGAEPGARAAWDGPFACEADAERARECGPGEGWVVTGRCRREALEEAWRRVPPPPLQPLWVVRGADGPAPVAEGPYRSETEAEAARHLPALLPPISEAGIHRAYTADQAIAVARAAIRPYVPPPG